MRVKKVDIQLGAGASCMVKLGARRWPEHYMISKDDAWFGIEKWTRALSKLFGRFSFISQTLGSASSSCKASLEWLDTLC